MNWSYFNRGKVLSRSPTMSSNENEPNPVTSDSILSMINNLKPSMGSPSGFHFEYDSPLKRYYNSSIDGSEEPDEASAKKIKLSDSSIAADYVGSPREVRRIRADLIESRNTIKGLQARIKNMHSIRKEMQIMFDEEMGALRKQNDRDRKSVEELENQLQTIRKREIETKKELQELRTKYDKLKINTDERIENLEKQLSEISTDFKYRTEEEDSELLNLRKQVSELEVILEAAQEDAEAQKKLVETLEKRLSEKVVLNSSLELKDQLLVKAQLQIKELEYLKESQLEFQQQAKLQQHKLSTYGELEKEIQQLKDETQRLKEEVRNKLLLEEEVYDLKNRLVHYKEQEKKLAELQVAHMQSDMYLEEWQAVARNICDTAVSDASLPRLLRATVERLQQQEINLTSDKVQLESQLNNALHEAKLAQNELEKNQKHIGDLNKNLQQKQNLFQRMQKKIQLLTRERDSYRIQLDSYEKDLTLCVNTTGGGQATSIQLQSLRERIETLEKIVEDYRDLNVKLENDLQNAEPSLYSDAVPIRVEQNIRLQEELERLKLENTELRDRKDRLEIQLEELLVGRDVAEGRILHPIKNPLSECLVERDNEVKKLQETVQRLKKKIRDMETGLEGSALENISLSVKDVASLKEQIKTLEVQNQRLKDYFKSSMQEFRNVIYMLLGYKIDKTSNSQYKLTSMYADRSEDQLCFQLNSEGALNLLENEFSSALEDMVDLHLRHQKSIPVFLSALTMDLFNNKTMTTRTYEIE